MESSAYDLIIVGGGLGGSTLAATMAERGARVLVLERERQFHDRVRGEWLAPWGSAEARALGIYDLLLDTCAHPLPVWDVSFGPMRLPRRDFVATTPQGLPALGMLHTEMQEVLLQCAVAMGAEVRRGAVVREVTPGATPSVLVECDGRSQHHGARLIVGADGRASMVRKWAGFTVRRDRQWLLISGLLFEDMDALAPEACQIVFNPAIGHAAFLFPQRSGRARAYLISPDAAAHRLQGASDLSRFLALASTTSMRPELYEGAHPAGPLATFTAADTAVDHPYRHGVALVGDAAASTDPTFGQGLSLTLRDVRVLRDCLLDADDWRAAADAYAIEHDRYYATIHRTNVAHADLFLRMGPGADARRARVFAEAAADTTRMPDHHFSGPDLPFDDTVFDG